MYSDKIKQATNDLTKTGVGLMAGHVVIGSMSALPGMPAQGKQAAGIIGTGLNIAAVGQLAKTAYNLLPDGSEVTVSVKKGTNTRKTTGDSKIDKMLGY